MYLELQRDNATQFHMIISSSYAFYNVYSFDNAMQPDDIRIGQELVGTATGSAQQAYFIQSRYVIGGTHYYQTVSGTPLVNSPVQAGWVYAPAPGNGGGRWFTYCGC